MFAQSTETVNETLQDAFATRDDLVANRNQMMEQASALVSEIHEFDRLYVNEKSSSQRLRLNRKQRETVKLFHDSLVGKLAALGNQGSDI